MPSPADPPASASIELSVRSWRTTRGRDAPMASRTAISCRRSTAPPTSNEPTVVVQRRKISSTSAVNIPQAHSPRAGIRDVHVAAQRDDIGGEHGRPLARGCTWPKRGGARGDELHRRLRRRNGATRLEPRESEKRECHGSANASPSSFSSSGHADTGIQSGAGIGLHRADEAWRCHTNDAQRHAIHADQLPDRLGRGTEGLRRVRVRRIVVSSGGPRSSTRDCRETSARDKPNPERGEEVRSDILRNGVVPAVDPNCGSTTTGAFADPATEARSPADCA